MTPERLAILRQSVEQGGSLSDGLILDICEYAEQCSVNDERWRTALKRLRSGYPIPHGTSWHIHAPLVMNTQGQSDQELFTAAIDALRTQKAPG